MRRMETAHGTLFVSMPSILDSSLAPAGRHIVHAFTPDWIDNWQVRRGIAPAVLGISMTHGMMALLVAINVLLGRG